MLRAVTGCAFRRYEQFETSPETIEQVPMGHRVGHLEKCHCLSNYNRASDACVCPPVCVNRLL